MVLGVNKREKKPYSHQLYMPTNPVGLSLFTVNIPSLSRSLSTIPWKCSLSFLPSYNPSLSSAYSSFHPSSSVTIHSLNPTLPPPHQAPEAGASLGEVWPTTGHWLWVIKVVQDPSPMVTGNCSWVIKALCHNYMDGQHHRPATLKQSASQLHGEEGPVCVYVCV